MDLRLFWKHFPSCLCSSLNKNELCYIIPLLKYCNQHIFVDDIVPSTHWQIWNTFMDLAFPFHCAHFFVYFFLFIFLVICFVCIFYGIRLVIN